MSSYDKKINHLLGILCVELGFCLPPEEHDRIASMTSWKAEDFAIAVITAEGLNPEHEPKWYREIRNRFIKHVGSNIHESANP